MSNESVTLQMSERCDINKTKKKVDLLKLTTFKLETIGKINLTSRAFVPLSIRSSFVNTPKVLSPNHVQNLYSLYRENMKVCSTSIDVKMFPMCTRY